MRRTEFVEWKNCETYYSKKIVFLNTFLKVSFFTIEKVPLK